MLLRTSSHRWVGVSDTFQSYLYQAEVQYTHTPVPCVLTDVRARGNLKGIKDHARTKWRIERSRKAVESGSFGEAME